MRIQNIAEKTTKFFVFFDKDSTIYPAFLSSVLNIFILELLYLSIPGFICIHIQF